MKFYNRIKLPTKEYALLVFNLIAIAFFYMNEGINVDGNIIDGIILPLFYLSSASISLSFFAHYFVKRIINMKKNRKQLMLKFLFSYGTCILVLALVPYIGIFYLPLIILLIIVFFSKE